MGEWIDKTKGKTKEVVGDITGNKNLETEGKLEHAKGRIKGAFEKMKQTVKDAQTSSKHEKS